VAASLQTPTLFKIAGDLSKMEIVLAIDEADIGQVKVGQQARFTVDAFPERNFRGRVTQLRLAATNTNNVITYPVVVAVDNPGQVLLPGMTANAEIEISRKDNALTVPNAALRFRPAEESNQSGPPGMAPARNAGAGVSGRGGAGMLEELPRIAAALRLDARQQAAFDEAMAKLKERSERMRQMAQQAQAAGGGQSPAGAGIAGMGGGRGFGGGNRGGQGQGGGNRGGGMGERMKQNFGEFRATLSAVQQQQWDAALAALFAGKRAPVYKLVDGKPEQVIVRLGASDGTRTELLGGELKEGELVIVGSARPDAK
jgi:HlyD family secretion protein